MGKGIPVRNDQLAGALVWFSLGVRSVIVVIIIVAVVLIKGKQWLIRLRMKDMQVKRHDSREEISASIALSKGTVAATIMGQSDTLCSTQAPPEEPLQLGIVKVVNA